MMKNQNKMRLVPEIRLIDYLEDEIRLEFAKRRAKMLFKQYKRKKRQNKHGNYAN